MVLPVHLYAEEFQPIYLCRVVAWLPSHEKHMVIDREFRFRAARGFSIRFTFYFKACSVIILSIVITVVLLMSADVDDFVRISRISSRVMLTLVSKTLSFLAYVVWSVAVKTKSSPLSGVNFPNMMPRRDRVSSIRFSTSSLLLISN